MPEAEAKAESLLRCAIEIARQQTALSWELRASTSLARLWSGAGRTRDAIALLAPVCDRFTEGFASADFLAAQRLLKPPT